MHFLLAAVLIATTPAPVDPVRTFRRWAEEQGTPIDAPACHVTENGDRVTCYGRAAGSGVVIGVASIDDEGNLTEFSPVPLAPSPTTTTTVAGTSDAATTAVATTTLPPPTSAPTVEASDPLFPVEPGANGPAVAAIQGLLGVVVDCDFGNQTLRAVEEWQQSAGIPVTGTIDPQAWLTLDVPTTWGDDANGNGTIDPSEVSLTCDGDVELPPPPPADTSDWPDTVLASVAATCSIPGESTGEGPYALYNPSEDMISIIGAGSAADPERGDEVFDTMVCVLGHSGAPDRVVNQVSQAGAPGRTQFAIWEGLTAQWSFDPDAGMNFTIYST